MVKQFASKSSRKYGTEELRNAGASEVFISLYLSAAEGRHSVREELDSGYGGTVLDDGRDPSEVAGGFFSKMWNGEVFDAFLHADGSNTPLMLEVFGARRIRNHAVNNSGYDIEYATTMVNERAEMFDFPTVE